MNSPPRLRRDLPELTIRPARKINASGRHTACEGAGVQSKSDYLPVSNDWASTAGTAAFDLFPQMCWVVGQGPPAQHLRKPQTNLVGDVGIARICDDMEA